MDPSTPSALPPIVLAFAATDPSGGAGLQADVMTLASMGCHPLSVVTAITIQDTMGVEEVMPLDVEWVADQARCVLEDMPVAAFKIGLLGSSENISAIAEVVSDYPEVPLVLDPVLASGRGDELVTEEMISALRELLIPQTTIITPNSTEARRLVQEEGEEDLDLAECARRLLAMGCEYVLITGTHEASRDVVNVLYDASGVVREDRWPRLPASYHGSGCTLAAALAAELARGLEPAEAAHAAQRFTWESLAAGFKAGGGQLLPNRFFRS
jgi:hydroxymethylpyrimidine/phosphomethylpyrimidine kinase